jgi:hypothetical protein
MKKKIGGSSKPMKKYAMAGEVGPGPKKKTPFQEYESKYPGYGGYDTLYTPATRKSGFDDYDWLKKSAAQKAALGSAFKKTYSNYDSKAGRFRDEDGDLGGPGVRRPGLKNGGSVGKSKKPKMSKSGSFGMLSVKKGIDKNPKPTAADRIAGATMKKGGMVKKSSKKK